MLKLLEVSNWAIRIFFLLSTGEWQSGPWLGKKLWIWGWTMFFNKLEACLQRRLPRARKLAVWSPPPMGVLKFNMDGATRGKLVLAGIGGVLRYNKGDVLLLFSKKVELKESNEAKVMAILEAFRLFISSFQAGLIIESDSSNSIGWISSYEGHWKFHFLLSDIKFMSSQGLVEFKHVGRLANVMVDSLGKQGVDKVVPLIAYTI